MALSKKALWQKITEYLGMTLAGLVIAVCMYCFVNPAKLVAGGLTGIASVLCFVIAAFVDGVTVDQLMSVMYLAINLPVMILSLIMLRGDFTFKSIYSIAISTVALAIFPKVMPDLQFNESPILSTILGGLLLGLGMYIAVLQGASNGGTEIIGKIVALKRPELDLSQIITILNFVITIVGGVVIVVVEKESIFLVMYSLLFVLIAGGFMGVLQRGFDHPQKFIILTANYQELSQQIMSQFKRGLTLVDVAPQSDNLPRKMIVVVVQYRQASALKQLIAEHDANAFTFVKDVHDVFSRPTFNRSYKSK